MKHVENNKIDINIFMALKNNLEILSDKIQW